MVYIIRMCSVHRARVIENVSENVDTIPPDPCTETRAPNTPNTQSAIEATTNYLAVCTQRTKVRHFKIRYRRSAASELSSST